MMFYSFSPSVSPREFYKTETFPPVNQDMYIISTSDSRYIYCCFVMSNSFQPHGMQHARPPCPSLSPGVFSDSCPLSWWCHLTISSSVIHSFFCPKSFTASVSFPTIWLFASGGQSIGASVSASVLPMNIQCWSPRCPRDSQESSPIPQFKLSVLWCSAFFIVQLYIHTWLLEKP